MNKLKLNRLDPQSVRLALTYLVIIMVFSVSFSFIFYRMSTNGLNGFNVQFKGSSRANGPVALAQSTSSATTEAIGFGSVPLNHQPPVMITTGNAAKLNSALQSQFATARSNLQTQLILLNIGALIFGAAFSYYMALKTIRPMKEAIDMQSRFAADASHELRTPLAIMQAEIDVVLRKSDLGLPRARKALKSNYEEVSKLKQLAEGLLTLTNDSHGDHSSSEVLLDDITNEAMNRVLKQAQAKGLSISDAMPKLKVKADTQSLVQVVTILLDNAIKYSPSKSHILIEGQAEGKYVYLFVRDDGPGIRATDIKHIFERFYRADTSRTKQKIEGYGLGLSIAQKIIRQNHGEIEVSSTLGKGSTFTIKLPSA